MREHWFFALRRFGWQQAMTLSVVILVAVTFVTTITLTIRPWQLLPGLVRFALLLGVAAVPAPVLILYLHRFLCYHGAVLIARRQMREPRYLGGDHQFDPAAVGDGPDDRAPDPIRLRYLFAEPGSDRYLLVILWRRWSTRFLSPEQARQLGERLGVSTAALRQRR